MRPRLPDVLGAEPDAAFPPVERALREPDGLLAVGGDLTPTRLLNAYRHGIFPWYSEGQPILWWSPDPRAVFETDRLRPNRRFARTLRASPWTVTADGDFDAVIDHCARVPRAGQHGTWITREMRQAYRRLHRLGHAHSIEVRDAGRLVGGVYGVAVGRMFFGESMFSLESGGSKVALLALAQRMREWGWPLLDAQVENPHLMSLGATLWPRARFVDVVEQLTALPEPAGTWGARFGTVAAAGLVRAG